MEKIINTLKKLMSFKTIEGEQEEFLKLFTYIKETMPQDIFITEYEFKGNKAMVISNTEEKKLDIIFCTHVDVIPADNYDLEIDGNILKGRGTIDMKGAVAVCLELFKNQKSNKKIALFITTDEEIDGYCAEKLVEQYDCNLAIIPDGGKDFELISEEKGLLQLEISIKTKSAHASQPYNGINAITTLMNVYNNLIAQYPLPKSNEEYITSINLSTITAGDAVNKVPDYATMKLDIRHTSKDKKEDIINNIKKMNENLEIKIIGSGILFETNIESNEIKNYLSVCNEVLSFNPKIVKTVATSDAIYFSAKGIPTALMNPYGDNPHCPNEYATIDGLEKLYEIYKKMI